MVKTYIFSDVTEHNSW